MYKTKKDVDKHVETLLSKVPAKEFKNRAFSIANLYFNVGDYVSCQKYVEQYITQKNHNAAAYKLLGQAFQKLGFKEKALEQYKISLDIDPTHTRTILDICELLVDDDMELESGHAQYWCEKAEATFPKHPITFKLREKLITMSNSDPEALIKLLNTEMAVRPKDVTLHIRLIKHYLHTNQLKEAFDHACIVEYSCNAFVNSITWYETTAEIFKQNLHNINDWIYQLLLLTIRERVCLLSLSEIPTGTSKSLLESKELLHEYDQALEIVAKAGVPSGFGEFHSALLQHHRGQFAFHSATFLLKTAKKDQMNWRDAVKSAAPLMLIAWQTVPINLNNNWLRSAPEKQYSAANRWYLEGTYRSSQSGHYLLSNLQDKSQAFLDQISQSCSGTHWRDKLYEKIFTSRIHLSKINSSHFVSNAYDTPILKLPKNNEIEIYDDSAQKQYGNSLHHFVWILLNYKNYAQFKCSIFDMLPYSTVGSGPESLNKLDVEAFLYCSALTIQQKISESKFIATDKPIVIPANITDLLCTLSQLKWWDCAYKFSQNELGTELTDIRSTLSHGIEVVRCVDNHGLDPTLLCSLGRIFSEKAKLTSNITEKSNLEERAVLYYSSAIPILEKLKSKMTFKISNKRMFDYSHKDLSTKELISLIEQSKLYIAIKHYNENDFDKVIELLSGLKSLQSYYYLSQTYKKIALEQKNLSKHASSDTEPKYVAMLTKAKELAFKVLEKFKELDTGVNRNDPLHSETLELIDDIDTNLNMTGLSNEDINEYYNTNYISEVNHSYDNVLPKPKSIVYRDISSTPKPLINSNASRYRTAMDSQLLESTRIDHQYLERIESEMKNLQKHDVTINNFMEQTKNWFEDNRKLSNQIMSTINSNTQSTTDQFKLLKVSIDQVKDQINECKNDCKDVFELKKQVAELKKEVNKLKKSSSEQAIDENHLYSMDDEYRTNETASNLTSQLPFNTAQVMPPFNQRIIPPFPVPPNPYQFYNQSLYNLYNQYTQFSQPPTVPGAPPIFDPTRAQMNYAGIYPTPEQMYLDVAPLVTANVPPPPVSNTQAVPVVPPLSTVHTIPHISMTSVAPVITSASTPKIVTESKEASRSLPVNVVITSSDPLPTCTSIQAPILSVTIPSKHIKNIPHNYQIPMPSTSESKVISPPVFSFPMSESKTNTTSSLSSWNQSAVFKTAQVSSTQSNSFHENSSAHNMAKGDGFTFNNSVTVVDGSCNDNSLNTSFNKSRTLSERSNTSVENYDPCPDFKPIVPLPAEVKVTTGEEDETVVFSSRAKLFRFVDKQWKERGLGEMKLLKHNITGKVRVLMRREQIHKICANHIITLDMEIKPMKNETKAYFWVANDFADEVLTLEKFCIRFKTADIARNFYETFENARIDSSNSSSEAVNKNMSEAPKNIFKSSEPRDKFVVSESGKPMIGGFTFSSTPTLKSVTEDLKTETKPTETTTNKVNVFSGLSFKTASDSPFSTLFNKTPASLSSSDSTNKNVENQKKLNSSDIIEDFEPTVEFKPVVPLPALVEIKTGEEDEIVLFEHRAKLLRFDVTNKEWKERGLGNIKLLAHQDNIQKLRLLMRREQIMKVCCNHAVTRDMVFQKMPRSEKDVTWCAKDFSEGELVPQTFCLRFKTMKLCDDFLEAIQKAQSKMKDETKAAKEESNAAKQTIQSGFGDKFKPKAGSWCCQACYTNNLENFTNCACCEQPRPQESSKDSVINSSWGDKFNMKAGGWECPICLIRHEADVQVCNACNTPKDIRTTPDNKSSAQNTFKFTFGIPMESVNQTELKFVKSTTPVINTVSSEWKDKFKPKEGTWECKSCYIRNEDSVENCCACNSPKVTSKDENSGMVNMIPKMTSNSTPKFNFGIPGQTITNTSEISFSTTSPALSEWGEKFESKDGMWECKICFVKNKSNYLNCCSCTNPKNTIPKIQPLMENKSSENRGSSSISANTSSVHNSKQESTSIFDGTGSHTFSFGVQNAFSNQNISEVLADKNINKNSLFGSPKIVDKTDDSSQFSLKQNSGLSVSETILKPALLPTPQKENTNFTLVGKESCTFDFVFKPKTPPSKGKSPLKSPKSEAGDETDDSIIPPDEDHCVQNFTPVVPLPEKVEVVTGEEDEIELYGHRAKLYRFTSGEWKERGIGTVKILKHKVTGRLRVVMRREQVLKICLNHSLKAEIIYTPKDDKTWLFAANDFSEGEFILDHFCLRFKSKEIAMEFKEAIDKALERIADKSSSLSPKPQEKDYSDDIIFVNEIQATAEEKEKAKELMLPLNFFNYKNKDPCHGCRGCNGQNDSEIETPTLDSDQSMIPKSLSTPIKNKTFCSQSSPGSAYGTPGTTEKTFDTSIFCTPLGSIGSVIKYETPTINEDDTLINDITNKENTFTQKSNNSLSKFNDQTSVLEKTETKDSEKSSVSRSSILAPPKLNALNMSIEKQTPEANTISATTMKFGESKQSFGNLNLGKANNSGSGFGFSANLNKTSDQDEVKSIFGGDQKPENIFTTSFKGSIFGPGALSSNQTKESSGLFGVQNQDSEKSIFGKNISIQDPSWKSSQANENVFHNKSGNLFEKRSGITGNYKDQKLTETLPFAEDTVTFADFASSGTGFKAKVNPDFQWEGAGQQLFVAAKRSGEGGKSGEGSADADDEYDPYYEPIVPLPEKITVVTGEEDEEKLFGERCKLFRYDEKSREWKERGVGELKILYHPERKTYRLLLRREQVHKAVLNMLLFMDLELLPLKNSDRAWTWAGRNYAETPAGEQETLAVRFKSNDLASTFHNKVVDCVRKLQAEAAKAIEKEKNTSEQTFQSAPPLRLPKHLSMSARADKSLLGNINTDFKAAEVTQNPIVAEIETKKAQDMEGNKPCTAAELFKQSAAELFKQVHFEEPAAEEHAEDDNEDDDEDDDEVDYEDYEDYYNEEEEDSAACFTGEGEAIVHIVTGAESGSGADAANVYASCAYAHITVLFDQELYSPKIIVTDSATGEILADMLIHTDTNFELCGGSCSWSGTDYTSNDPIEKRVTISFFDSEAAMQFYDSCETSKAATYTSTDPES